MALGQRKSVRWITSAIAVPITIAKPVVSPATTSVVRSVSMTPGETRPAQFSSVQCPSGMPGAASRKLPRTSAETGISARSATTAKTAT